MVLAAPGAGAGTATPDKVREPPALSQDRAGDRNTVAGLLGSAMSDVEFPAMRLEVVVALAALADGEYQQRTWLDYDRSAGARDNLDVFVNTLYADWNVLPEPEKALWTVLLPGDEVARLRALDAVLGR